jgi:hypothetical protein
MRIHWAAFCLLQRLWHAHCHCSIEHPLHRSEFDGDEIHVHLNMSRRAPTQLLLNGLVMAHVTDARTTVVTINVAPLTGAGWHSLECSMQGDVGEPRPRVDFKLHRSLVATDTSAVRVRFLGLSPTHEMRKDTRLDLKLTIDNFRPSSMVDWQGATQSILVWANEVQVAAYEPVPGGRGAWSFPMDDAAVEPFGLHEASVRLSATLFDTRAVPMAFASPVMLRVLPAATSRMRRPTEAGADAERVLGTGLSVRIGESEWARRKARCGVSLELVHRDVQYSEPTSATVHVAQCTGGVSGLLLVNNVTVATFEPTRKSTTVGFETHQLRGGVVYEVSAVVLDEAFDVLAASSSQLLAVMGDRAPLRIRMDSPSPHERIGAEATAVHVRGEVTGDVGLGESSCSILINGYVVASCRSEGAFSAMVPVDRLAPNRTHFAKVVVSTAYERERELIVPFHMV